MAHHLSAFEKMRIAFHEKKSPAHNILSEYLAAIGERMAYNKPLQRTGKPPFEIFSGSAQVSILPAKKFSGSGKNKKELRENICNLIIQSIVIPDDKSENTKTEPLRAPLKKEGMFHLVIETPASFLSVKILLEAAVEKNAKIIIVGPDPKGMAIRYPDRVNVLERTSSNDNTIIALFEYKSPVSPDWIVQKTMTCDVFMIIDKKHATGAIAKIADYINGVKV